MNSIFFPVFRSVMRRRETKIFLIFSLIPILYFLSTFIGSKLFSVSSEGGIKMAFFDFLSGQFNLQFTSILPSIALAFLAISVFRMEIQSHTLFLYKDIAKRKIFNAKILSLITIILIYVASYFLITLVVYYTRVAYLSYGSTQFWSSDGAYTFMAYSSIIMAYFIIAFIASTASQYLTNGFVVVIVLLCNILMSLASIFPSVGYLLPLGYSNFAEHHGLFLGLGVTLGITTIYLLLSYILGLEKFKKLEF